MGFLDHSTNNIIVDAVLTDKGRERLASGQEMGQFIVYYSFADEEVDYSLITKYGTVIGKQKIEKNTPIFEASTDGTKKYPLLDNQMQISVLNTTWDSTNIVDINNVRNLNLSTTTSGSYKYNLNLSVPSDSGLYLANGSVKDQQLTLSLDSSTSTTNAYVIQVSTDGTKTGIYTLSIVEADDKIAPSYIQIIVQ